MRKLASSHQEQIAAGQGVLLLLHPGGKKCLCSCGCSPSLKVISLWPRVILEAFYLAWQHIITLFLEINWPIWSHSASKDAQFPNALSLTKFLTSQGLLPRGWYWPQANTSTCPQWVWLQSTKHHDASSKDPRRPDPGPWAGDKAGTLQRPKPLLHMQAALP